MRLQPSPKAPTTAALLLALLLALLAAITGGCAGTPVEDPPEPKKLLTAETITELERLFAPMQAPRGTIACNTLLVRTHRALWDRFTYPVRSRVCELTFIKGEGGAASSYVFKNVGGVDYPLKFVIGQRTFLVLAGARLEVHGGAPRFELVADGNVIAQDLGQQAREASALRLENGRWSER